MKKLLKNMLIGTIALGATFFVAAPIYAAGEDVPSPDIHLTKTLITPSPDVVKLPDKFTFKFTVAEGSFFPHGSDKADPSITVPDIGDQQLDFDSKVDKGSINGGVKTTHKQTANLLTGVTFPQPGVYVYTIKEIPDTNILADPTKEKLKYSTKEYTLKVYVSRNTDGTPLVDGGIVIDKDTNLKVDPKPTKPLTPGGSHEVETANGFVFQNIYIKDAGSVTPPDPEDITSGLMINKIVVGDLANAQDEFTYNFKLENNPLLLEASYTLSTPSGDIPVKPGETVTFKLKGGEKVNLKKIPAGTKFTVIETKYDYYTPKNELILNSVPTASSSDVEAGGIMGEKANKVTYTNTWNKTTPTGVIMNNLPYVVLVVVAIGGFAFYIVTKRHKRS